MQNSTAYHLEENMSFYSEQTHESRFPGKRWAHRSRFRDALKLLSLTENDTFLDFGCGDGFLLELASRKTSPDKIFGYEPSEMMRCLANERLGDSAHIFSNPTELENMKFAKISSLEVFEHLPEKELSESLGAISKMLESDGLFLVSVPIEIGISAIIKNKFRLLTGKTKNLSLGNFYRSALGLHCKRAEPERFDGLSYIFSHIGFDFRNFRKLLETQFTILKTHYSPFPILRGLANNVVYYLCGEKTGNCG